MVSLLVLTEWTRLKMGLRSCRRKAGPSVAQVEEFLSELRSLIVCSVSPLVFKVFEPASRASFEAVGNHLKHISGRRMAAEGLIGMVYHFKFQRVQPQGITCSSKGLILRSPGGHKVHRESGVQWPREGLRSHWCPLWRGLRCTLCTRRHVLRTK